MRILVTGSAGHLGEALVRTLRAAGREVIGLDILRSPFTTHVGSIADGGFVRDCLRGVDAVLHAATLHKPHIASHNRRAFIETNIIGTQNLLDEAVHCGVSRFVFTSTTSVFGRALRPPDGDPAVWVTESLVARPRNIYGVTKAAAEDLCELAHLREGLACVVLRTSRFFPEEDDDPQRRSGYEDANLKAIEFLYRRSDIQDIVDAHLQALEQAPRIGFGKYIVSATTPFLPEDAAELAVNAAAVVARRVPGYEAELERRGWRMLPRIRRVYDNAAARNALDWTPRYDFRYVIEQLQSDRDHRSGLAREIGSKGYHAAAPTLPE